jgi:hypothetical protein
MILIDTTECPINRPTNFILQRILYSGYKRKTTLKYLVATTLQGNPIFWAGPMAGPTADIVIFRRYLKSIMIQNSWIGIVDGTFQGESSLLLVRLRRELTPHERNIYRLLNKRRVKIENFFARLKSFKCFSTSWRH